MATHLTSAIGAKFGVTVIVSGYAPSRNSWNIALLSHYVIQLKVGHFLPPARMINASCINQPYSSQVAKNS
jgi:hypothetical protein